MKSNIKLIFFTLVFLGTPLFSYAGNQLINGAGATFPEPIYNKWFLEFKKINPETSINYQGIGSGGGIKQLINGTVDFAATDLPMNADETKALKNPVIHIPTIIGAVVVSHNLKIEKPLILNGETVANIFSGKITKWNDEKIAKLNPGLKLPGTAIVVATRSDGSGTTAVFTDYLSKVSSDWKGKAAKTVDWLKGSVAAKGNAGVAGLIQQGEGTIGYIELVYALQNKISFAQIINKKGKAITANSASVTAAASGQTSKEIIKNNLQLSITDSESKEAYPISSMTWLLIPETLPKDKGDAIVKMLNWSMSKTGQDMATQLNYAALPKEINDEVIKKIKSIKIK